MNLNIEEIRSYGLLAVFKLVNPAQIHQILAVLAVLLSGHIKNIAPTFLLHKYF